MSDLSILFRQLWYFSARLLKQTILYLLLLVDLITLGVTIYMSLEIPFWIFVVLPLLALFLASFTIYRQVLDGIKVIFADPKTIIFRCEKQGGGENKFEGLIYGMIINHGPEKGIIEELKGDLYSVDGKKIDHKREVVEERLHRYAPSPFRRDFEVKCPLFLKGKIEFERYLSTKTTISGKSSEAVHDTLLVLPMYVNPGDIIVFTMVCKIVTRGQYGKGPLNPRSPMPIELEIGYLVRHMGATEKRKARTEINAYYRYD